MKTFRFFISFAFLFTIIVNFIFFTKTAAHFGGGMTYAITEAERQVYKDYFEEEPVDYDLNLKHPELLDKILFIDWHDNWTSKFFEARPSFRSGSHFYFFTQKMAGKGVRFLEKEGYELELHKAVNFLDAPPLIFRVFKGLANLKPGLGTAHQIFIYKIEAK